MNPAEVRFVVDPPARLLAAAVLLRAIVHVAHGCPLEPPHPVMSPLGLGLEDCEVVGREDVVDALHDARQFIERQWDGTRPHLNSLLRARVWMLLRRGDADAPEPQGAA